jgi:hypothetical protein
VRVSSCCGLIGAVLGSAGGACVATAARGGCRRGDWQKGQRLLGLP